MNTGGAPLFKQQLGQGVSQMKGVRGLVVVFKDGRRREFKLKKETKWQFVFSLLKWIVYFILITKKLNLCEAMRNRCSFALDKCSRPILWLTA
jgi:hypothetical protein